MNNKNKILNTSYTLQCTHQMKIHLFMNNLNCITETRINKSTNIMVYYDFMRLDPFEFDCTL